MDSSQTSNIAATSEAQLAQAGEKQLSVENLEFVCESDGYRYYKDPKTGRQCCLDSAGLWYVLNEEKAQFEAMISSVPMTAIHVKQQSKQVDKTSNVLRNVERFGIRFDQHGKPVFPKNDKGLYVLPKDEKGSPFFPMDDRGIPIFPWDQEKGMPTFPVDDTEEPIFPRNDQNKPIVPKDSKGQPIFPVDKAGTFIFPIDESNCPIPALTTDGVPVIPKDEFGNLVIPKDRDGKPLIHIASDGATPISMADWKQWKKYYKEQARNFYHQQQQQQQAHQLAMGVADATRNSYPINSMFHPLNLEQQSAYFAADMEMLQRVRRVRPEDVDLPGHTAEGQTSIDPNSKQLTNGSNAGDDKLEKRKKFLQAQLKSAKKVVTPLPPIPKKTTEEEPKKNGLTTQQKDPKKYEPRKAAREMVQHQNRKRGRDQSQESIRRRRSRTRSPKRRRYSSSSSRSRSSRSRSYSYSRSRSRSSRSTRRSSRNSYRRRRRSSSRSYSSRSRTTSHSSYSSYSSDDRRSRSQSRPLNRERDEEEERIRDRIIARTNAAGFVASVAPSQTEAPDVSEALEYGPKPPESLEHSTPNSDMEMSEDEHSIVPVPPVTTKNTGVLGVLTTKSVQNELGGRTHIQTKKQLHGELSKEPEAVMKEKHDEQQLDSFNVKEVIKSNNIELIKLCKRQELERYDRLKLQIAELEVEKSVHKRNWAQLREAEKRVEGYRSERTLSTSGDESK